jgi:anaerobic glycerol-3-phosphate dehydrogenase
MESKDEGNPTLPPLLKAARLEDPELRRRFEENLRIWEEKGRPVIEAAQASERLTERDLAIRINTLA